MPMKLNETLIDSCGVFSPSWTVWRVLLRNYFWSVTGKTRDLSCLLLYAYGYEYRSRRFNSQVPSTYAFRCKIEWKQEITTSYRSLRRDFARSLILGFWCPFKMFSPSSVDFDARFNRKISITIPLSSPENSTGCRESYLKRRSKYRENHHYCCNV